MNRPQDPSDGQRFADDEWARIRDGWVMNTLTYEEVKDEPQNPCPEDEIPYEEEP